MSNSNITKQAIANAFKQLMETLPFDKISISDITKTCGLNRQSFYYHFQDKYELINWIFENEIINIISDGINIDNWNTKIRDMFTLIQKDKKFYSNAIKHTNSEFHSYILKVATDQFRNVVKKMQLMMNQQISQKDETFIADFFGYGTAGVVVEWVETGMKETPDELATRLEHLVVDCDKLAVEHYLGNLNVNTSIY